MKRSCGKYRNTLFLIKKQYGKGGPRNISKHSEGDTIWEEKQQCIKVSKQVTWSSLRGIIRIMENGTWAFQENSDEIRAIEARAGKGKLERAIQHLFPLELSCEVNRQPNIAILK